MFPLLFRKYKHRNKMKKYLLSALLLLSPSYVSSECVHTSYNTYIPEKVLCKDAYAMKFNSVTKNPDIVWYKLDIKNTIKKVSRTSFKLDKNISKEYQSSMDDYYKSGFDRGHIAPANKFRWSKDTMKQSMLMINMTPQYPSFNRGIWKSLEYKVGKWLKLRKELLIIAGPIYKCKPCPKIHRVTVPTHFFKIVYDYQSQESISFLIPNSKTRIHSKNLKNYLISIDNIELLIDHDLLDRLDDTLEEAIESKKETSLWKLK